MILNLMPSICRRYSKVKKKTSYCSKRCVHTYDLSLYETLRTQLISKFNAWEKKKKEKKKNQIQFGLGGSGAAKATVSQMCSS